MAPGVPAIRAFQGAVEGWVGAQGQVGLLGQGAYLMYVCFVLFSFLKQLY